MNPIELIHLAARAVKYRVESVPDHEDKIRIHAWINEACCIEWNPLLDDGEALRLAMGLRISIRHEEDFPAIYADYLLPGRMAQNAEYVEYTEDCEFDRMQAVRLAIVMAAAEIGARTP